jgi:ribosome maturation protein SDO1
MVIQQPSNQIKLTNVSLVRLKKGKKRFEIACYKNKVLEWRSGIETDLDNVLQIPSVFLNVSKGQTAPSAELAKAFGKDMSVDDIILEILRKGELQVGEKERNAQLERVHAEVVSIVASKLVDPRTKRVYTPGMIEKALDMLSSKAHQQQPRQQQQQPHAQHHQQNNNNNKSKAATSSSNSATASATGTPATGEPGESKPRTAATTTQPPSSSTTTTSTTPTPTWTGVVTNKSAKSQALDAMRALIAHQPIPVARARMRLRITCATGVLKQVVKAPQRKQQQQQQQAGDKTAEGGGGGGEGDGEGEQRAAAGTVKDKILSFVEQVESQDVIGSEWEVVGFVEPGAFKGLSDFISTETKGQGRVEVLDMAVTHED